MNIKMRHTVYMLIGKELSLLAPSLKQYVVMYGENEVVEYLQVFSVCRNEGDFHFKSYVNIPPQDEVLFTSGIENRYQIGTAYEENLSGTASIQQYLIDLFNRTVTIDNPGENGTLNVVIVLPLYDKELWSVTNVLLEEWCKSGRQINIDILGLPSSLAWIICNDEQRRKELPELSDVYKSTVKDIAKDIVSDSRVHRLLLFEDCNSKGLALNLDIEGLIRIIGEYSMLAVEHYPCIFPANQIGTKIDATSFGLSMLAFDKIYFVEYLLHNAYLEILGKENVGQKKVNINKASEWAATQLEKHVPLYSNFIRERVEPLLKKKHETGDLSVSDTQQLESELQDILDSTVAEMQSFIKDENRSLPEKQAIMALLLGEDDPLLVGVQYEKGQLTIDDCDKETLELYIGEDNKQVRVVSESEGKPKRIERGVLTAPVNENEQVYLPLDEMKQLRAQIRQRTSYIREKTDELNAIQTQVQEVIDLQKRITDGGFCFEGTTFKLLPSDKEIRLFESNYVPKGHGERSVDLRNNFTSIKSQGEIGACSAFSLVSIFEYIMKKANPSNPNLSEHFVYYNALRFANGGNDDVQDIGSSFFDVVSALSTEGLCSEELCKYEDILVKPTEEAYKDGLSRLVKEAKNVEISHEALTSAIAEGYPVAISLKIYDSFDAGKNGFVYRPTNDEINASEGGNHAMVICGFSEEDKVYIVRNSWGTKFGDKGYCYIPFSYVDDPQLNNQACIITDIEVKETVEIKGVEKRKAVSFNMTDDSIRASILKILIGEEEILLDRDNKNYTALRFSYEKLLQTLSNPSKRDVIFEHSVERIDKDLEDARNKYDDFIRKSRPEELKKFKDLTLKNLIYVGLCSLGSFVLTGLFIYIEYYRTMLLFSVMTIISIILVALYYFYRKHQLSNLKEKLESQAAEMNTKISKLEQEKNEKHLRMHLAGRVISSLTDIKLKLINKYHALTGYVSSLDKWSHEEQQNLIKMVPPSKTPCIQMLDNDILERYFQDNKSSIVDGIHLYDLVDSYSLTDDDILKFKIQIRDKLIGRLEQMVESFSMVSYLIGDNKYEFLPECKKISDLMPVLDKRSDCFVHITQTNVSIDDSLEKTIFIHTQTQSERNNWRDSYKRYFSQQPGDEDLSSLHKLIEVQIQNLLLDQVEILN